MYQLETIRQMQRVIYAQPVGIKLWNLLLAKCASISYGTRTSPSIRDCIYTYSRPVYQRNMHILFDDIPLN
jgi:hypothetical protein